MRNVTQQQIISKAEGKVESFPRLSCLWLYVLPHFMTQDYFFCVCVRTAAFNYKWVNRNSTTHQKTLLLHNQTHDFMQERPRPICSLLALRDIHSPRCPLSCNSLGPQCAWAVLLVTDVKTTFKIPNARLSKAVMAVICKSVAWQKRPALCQYLFSKTVWVLVLGDSAINNWHFMPLLRVEVGFYTAVMFALFYLLCKVNLG